MRDQKAIENEIDSARGDLESTLGELKDVMQDRLDLRKRAHELVDRGKHEARELFDRVKVGVRERPGVAVLAAIGLIGLFAAAAIESKRRRERMVVSSATIQRLRKELCI